MGDDQVPQMLLVGRGGDREMVEGRGKGRTPPRTLLLLIHHFFLQDIMRAVRHSILQTKLACLRSPLFMTCRTIKTGL